MEKIFSNFHLLFSISRFRAGQRFGCAQLFVNPRFHRSQWRKQFVERRVDEPQPHDGQKHRQRRAEQRGSDLGADLVRPFHRHFEQAQQLRRRVRQLL